MGSQLLPPRLPRRFRQQSCPPPPSPTATHTERTCSEAPEAMGFSAEQTQEFREAFSLFDKKGDNRIRVGDLGTVLRALGQNPSEEDVKKIQAEVDSENADTRITFEDFLPILERVKDTKPPGTQGDYIEGLRVFDKDGNGTINAAELRHVLTTLGEKLSDDEVDALLTNIAIDSSGSVNYEEFVRTVMS